MKVRGAAALRGGTEVNAVDFSYWPLTGVETVMLAIILALIAAFAVLGVYTHSKFKSRKNEPKTSLPAEEQNNPAPDFYPAGEEEGEIPTVLGEISMAGGAETGGFSAVAPPVFGVSAELEAERNAMRYNRSFRARLIQSDDELKEWYGILKNEILSYDRVTDRISWKYESFSYRRNAVAKFFIKGKTLCLYLALDPAEYAGSKYSLEDESAFSQFKDTPALYRIKSEKRVRYAAELIAEVCARLHTEKTEREPVDYYEPYNGTLALIQKGLIKRVIENADESFTGAKPFNAAQDEVSVESDE